MTSGARPGLAFELLEQIGAGGMGTVHRARSEAGELLAVKLLGARAPGAAERFLREAEVLSSLEHPHIVRYCGHGVMPSGEAFLAMEWLEGEDLAARLSRGALPVDEAVLVASRIAEGLAVAHARGVVHRDVKPSNVFLVGGDPAAVRVLDFGIARIAGGARATRTGAVLGTPGYMAPEQARGERHLGPEVDVFALGCVLYECLTGAPAFWAEHLLALLGRILLEDPVPPGRLAPVQPALEALTMRMLSKDPADRPRDGAEVALALERAAPSSRSVPATISFPLGDREQTWASIVLARDPVQPQTADAATMAPGELDDVARLARDLAPLGSLVAKLVDGTLVATFPDAGAPRERAARAARAGLLVRAALAPSARVVVVTGRGERGAPSVVGAVLDQGARLLALPPHADGPRIDRATAGLLDPRFSLGGDAESLVLRHEQSGEDAPRRLLGQPSPCVGRDRELASLTALFDECVQERAARAVLLVAPPGSGKSRLRHELLSRIAQREEAPSVWIARGDAVSAGSPRGMLVQILRGVAGLQEGEAAEVARSKVAARVSRHVPPAHVARVAAFLGEVVGAAFPDEGLPALRGARRDPVALGDQIAEAFEDLLVAELAAGPVALVLEDLHWGDLPTVRAIDRALRRLHDAPLFVVATARPEVHEVFPSLWSGRPVEEVRLAPLGARAAERLVRAMLGDRVDATAVARIVARSEGNAFVLEELIRAADAGEEVPDTAVAMTAARLDALPDELRRVLRAASVFGESAWAEGVAALLGEAPVEGALRRLVDAEVLEPRPESRFEGCREVRFRHALLRDAAYAALTPDDLARGHRAAAHWLASMREQDDLLLAAHFERGGEPSLAATHLARATERALEGNDFASVVRHGRRAVERGGGEVGLAHCHRLLADAEQALGRYEEGLADARAAMRLSEEGTKCWYRSIMLQVICLQRLSRMDEVLELAAEAARAGAEPEAVPTRIEVLVRLAMRLNFFSRIPPELPLLDLAEACDPSGDGAALGWLEAGRGVRAHQRGDLPVYIHHTERAADLLEAAGQFRDALSQREDLGWWWQHCGRFDRAEEVTRKVIAEAERIGLWRVASNAHMALVWEMIGVGRSAEAVQLAEGLLADRATGADAAAVRMFLAWALLSMGRVDVAAELLRAVRSEVERGGGYWRVASGFLAEALLALGHREEARAVADDLTEVVARAGARAAHFDMEAHCSLARVRRSLGDEAAARAAVVVACDQSLRLLGGFSDPEARAFALQNVMHHRSAATLARELGVETALLAGGGPW